MTKTIIGTIVVVLILAAGWLFSKAPVTNEPANATESTTVTTSDISTSPEQSIVQPEAIKISGNEFSYEPATISAKVGQLVTVTYTNAGKYPHNFVIDELGVTSQTIKPGQTDTFSFTPTKAGTFSFYCSLPNHREKGMVGEISVN